MPIMEINLIPLGTKTVSVSQHIKKAIRVLNKHDDIQYQLTSMGTIIEASSLKTLLKIAGEMHRAVLEDNNRVVTSIKIDDRKDKQVTAEDKVKSVCSENEQLSPEVKKWLQYKSKNFLEKLGFKRHHVVFDFGCRSGNYTIPAAEIVGITGRVYGTDKDKNRLKTLTEKAAAKKLNNITILESSNWHTEIKENPVDHIMLFDVLHPGYFPTKSARKNLLRKIYKVLKPGGIISIVPTHVEQRDLPMKDFIEEVENPGFSLKKSFEEFLVHDRKLEKCRILQFQKQQKEKSHGKNKR
jgi:uncharacterized protein (TIGR00106 family)